MADSLTPLIPRKVLFGNPDRAGVQISRDGSMLSYLAPRDGVLNVWVAPVDDPEAARPITNDKGRGIRYAAWTHTPGRLIYIQDKDGDENWRIYRLDVETEEVVCLTPQEGVRAHVQAMNPERPNEIVVGLNDRDPRYHDLYILNLDTGERTLLVENDRFTSFILDRDFTPRYATQMRPDGGLDVYALAGDQWMQVERVPMEDALTFGYIGFNRAGDTLYRIDSRGRDTAALIAKDTNTGEERVLFEDPQADVTQVMRHPYTLEVQAAASEYTRRKWSVFDPAVAEDLEYLGSLVDGELHVVSRTLDDSRWIVLYELDTGPYRYYLYDRKKKQAEFLFTNREALEGMPLAPMHPVVIEARDGLKLVSYLTLPPSADPDRTGRPKEPIPMVLFVHGGPWARDRWGYHSFHQHLANRGYAVLSVNYRGSTGFGKSFINAGNKEWGRKMHNDLIDAVNWAIAEGIADEDKVAIMGGSYGGYAALAGLTLTPDVFCAAVDLVGPSNLVTLLESIPPYWEPMVAQFTQRVGDHRTEEGRALLRERSPITYVDRIKKPLLIGQGANDPRVKQAESDQIVGAMQERGIPVTYLLYPDEGHGFARPENNLSFNAVAEAFLAEHLGGRCEPFATDFEGSSMQVKTGADQVPGLADALRFAETG